MRQISRTETRAARWREHGGLGDRVSLTRTARCVCMTGYRMPSRKHVLPELYRRRNLSDWTSATFELIKESVILQVAERL
jgi:hypothetical protein